MISVVVPQFHATTEAERVIQFGMNILTKGFGNLQTEIAQQIEDLIKVLPSINQAVIISPANSTRNIIQPSAAAVIPLTIRGAASQSANLLVLEDSAGTDLTYFTAAGNLVLTPLTASLPVFTNGSKQLVSNAMTGTGSVVMSASPTGTGTWNLANLLLSGTLGVTGVHTAGVINASGIITSTAVGGGEVSGVQVQGTSCAFGLKETDAGTDLKWWDIAAFGNALWIRAVNDASNSAKTLIKFERNLGASFAEGDIHILPDHTTAKTYIGGDNTYIDGTTGIVTTKSIVSLDPGSGEDSAFLAQSPSPSFGFRKTNEGTNDKQWSIDASQPLQLIIKADPDASSSGGNDAAITITRIAGNNTIESVLIKNLIATGFVGSGASNLTGAVTNSALTANGVMYANGSNVLSSHSNLTWDTATLALTGALTVSTTAIITGALTAQSTLGVTGNFAVNTSKFTVNASTGNTVINAPNGTGNTSLTIHALHDGTGPNSGEAFSVINDDTALEVVSIMGNGAATFLNASVEQLFVNSTIPTSPGIYDTSTWNNGAVNHEAWVASITNTASGGSSNLIRMTVSEVDAFRVSKIGDGYFSGDIEAVDISGSVFTASRLAVAQGTITTDVKNISATVTWNNAAVDFIAWDLQAVSSASGAASKLVRLRTGVIETFSIGKLGVINSYDLVGFGSRFLYANAAGDIVPGGLTSTYITGTGTDNQIATWSGTSTQDGSANLTFDGSTLAVTGALTVSTTAIITGALTAQSTLGVTGTSQFTGDITLVTGCDFILGTTGAGHKWATGATQLQAWWGATPVDQPAHIADPTGGAIVDAEARTAINAILAQLAETGLQAAA